MPRFLRVVGGMLSYALMGMAICLIAAVALFVILDLFGAPTFTLKLGPVAFIGFDQTEGLGLSLHVGLYWLGLLLGLALWLKRQATRQG